MFKKLKDKIAEEVKQSPQRIQQMAQEAAQVCFYFPISVRTSGRPLPVTNPCSAVLAGRCQLYAVQWQYPGSVQQRSILQYHRGRFVLSSSPLSYLAPTCAL